MYCMMYVCTSTQAFIRVVKGQSRGGVSIKRVQAVDIFPEGEPILPLRDTAIPYKFACYMIHTLLGRHP